MSYTRRLFKDSDESVANSTTLQDDDELITPLEVGTYRFMFEIWSEAPTAADFKFQCAFTGTSTALRIATESSKPGDTTMVVERSDTSFPSVSLDSTTTGVGFTRVTGVIIVSVAGDLKLTWAQVTSDATATKVLAGSSLEIERVA